MTDRDKDGGRPPGKDGFGPGGKAMQRRRQFLEERGLPVDDEVPEEEGAKEEGPEEEPEESGPEGEHGEPTKDKGEEGADP